MTRLSFVFLLLYSPLLLYAQESAEDTLYKWINRIRHEQGLSLLEREEILETSAQSYAEQLMQKGGLTHRDNQNNGPLERYSLQGGTAMAVGEILGTKSRKQSLDLLETMWWESETHRAQILNPRWTTIGLSCIERGGIEIYAIQFSTSLMTEYRVYDRGDSYVIEFLPLSYCPSLIFYDAFTRTVYKWTNGDPPILSIEKTSPALILEVSQNENDTPSNRVVFY